MNSSDTIAVLCRLLAIHNRSLAVYLKDAAPWTPRGHEESLAAVQRIATDHLAMVDRIGEIIVEDRGVVITGKFPLHYAAYHDLSLDFLIGQLVENEKEHLVAIGECVDEIDDDPVAKALAREALSQAQGHLDALEEIAQQAAGGG